MRRAISPSHSPRRRFARPLTAPSIRSIAALVKKQPTLPSQLVEYRMKALTAPAISTRAGYWFLVLSHQPTAENAIAFGKWIGQCPEHFDAFRRLLAILEPIDGQPVESVVTSLRGSV